MTDLAQQIAKTFDLFPDAGPSRNISEAWLVVSAMKRRGYHFALHVFSDGVSYAIFHYGKFGDGDLDERGTALTVSTPEAICRAALEALKNDNP